MPTVSEVTDSFLNRFDGNDDGRVTKSEFLGALDAEGVDQETRKLMYDLVYANWDGDDNTVLSKAEIKSLADKWASFK